MRGWRDWRGEVPVIERIVADGRSRSTCCMSWAKLRCVRNFHVLNEEDIPVQCHTSVDCVVQFLFCAAIVISTDIMVFEI